MSNRPESSADDGEGRRQFLTASSAMAAGLFGSSLVSTAQAGARTMPDTAPKCLFFDVNETLLDLTAMKKTVAAALGGREDLLPLWFTTMLQYSLVATVGDHYEDFGVIGAAALQMVAANNGIELSERDAQEAIAPIRSLPPHPDVRPALEKLKAAGYRMVTITNSSQKGVDTQICNAGLEDLFEQRLSVEPLQIYKPHSRVYHWGARKLGLQNSECLLVAAHGWDVAGAMWAGWRAAFLSRPGAQLYPRANRPEIVEPDLLAAADKLIAMKN